MHLYDKFNKLWTVDRPSNLMSNIYICAKWDFNFKYGLTTRITNKKRVTSSYSKIKIQLIYKIIGTSYIRKRFFD